MTEAVVAAAAALVAAIFSVSLARRYVARGRVSRALVSWSLALAMFAVASAALAVGAGAGWTSGWFRVFYLFGAVLTVPWLALGTVHTASRDPVALRVLGVTALVVALLLAVPASTADDAARFLPGIVLAVLWGAILVPGRGEAADAASVLLVVTLSVAATFAVLGAALSGPLPTDRLPEGSELLAPVIRGLAIGANALGATLVVVGGVASAIRLRGRQQPHLVVGNILIAIGVLVAASGGAFAFVGETASHAVAFAVGVAIMYAGFVRTTRPAEARPPPLVQVFTREDCGLCEQAERLAREESGAAEVRLVDVDRDPALMERYGDRVPVVVVEGREAAAGRVEPGRIRSAVRDAQRGR
ncbi:MAG: glutaredoxin family protein [Nitriliruptorales bacterium]